MAHRGSSVPGRPWLPHVPSSRRTLIAPSCSRTTRHARLARHCFAQQGLRPTTSGGHYAVEASVRAQFGTILRPFGALRRRRNELEYPLDPGDRASTTEAADGIRTAAELIDAADKILPELGMF